MRLECNAHFCLSGAGAEMPQCLPSGAWEQAKTCEPIMCPPYVAPPHAVVVPSAPVPAGQQVHRSGSRACPAAPPFLAAPPALPFLRSSPGVAAPPVFRAQSHTHKQVTIYCEEGYAEYYGGGETAGLARAAGAVDERARHSDPWFDFSPWFAGANQGHKGHLISMQAGPRTALATVAALHGGSGAHGPRRGQRARVGAAAAVQASLGRVRRRLRALARRRRELAQRVSKGFVAPLAWTKDKTNSTLNSVSCFA